MLTILILLFWLPPMVMVFIGAIQLKKNPPKAKKLIIAAGAWWIIGLLSVFFFLYWMRPMPL